MVLLWVDIWASKVLDDGLVCHCECEQMLIVVVIALDLDLIIIEEVWHKFKTAAWLDQHPKDDTLAEKVAHEMKQCNYDNCTLDLITKQKEDLYEKKEDVEAA